MYQILIKKKVLKNIEKMPQNIQMKLGNLLEDLQEKGPYRSEWPNYSKLSKNEYHCHLSHKWVACWNYEKNRIIIEVYYAGSRENAPY
jgi:mRNA-degrading endonuclease RelE of RelBE toxin-antitoxin system